MGLLNKNILPSDYYGDSDSWGSYQFTSLDDIISGFMISYVGSDKVISRVKRADVQYHAKRGLQELNFDTFKSYKAQEIEIPSSLTMILPQDYVNYVKLAWSDSAGIEHTLYPAIKTSNPIAIVQTDSGDVQEDLITNGTFDVDMSSWNSATNSNSALQQTLGNANAAAYVWDDNNILADAGLYMKVYQTFAIQAGKTYKLTYTIGPPPFAFTHTGLQTQNGWNTDPGIIWLDVSPPSNITVGTEITDDAGVIPANTTITQVTVNQYNFQVTLQLSNDTTAVMPGGTTLTFTGDSTMTGRITAYLASTTTSGDDTYYKSGGYNDTPGTYTKYITVDALATSTSSNSWAYNSALLGRNLFFQNGSPTENLNCTIDNVSLFDTTLTTQVESDTWSNYKSGTPSENQSQYDDDTYWPMTGERYGLDPQHAQANGSFFIDQNTGKIHFSSNISGKTVTLKYISDGLGTDEEMVVHKFAEEALYKHIAYGILSTRINTPEYIVRRFKREKFTETRKAKLRLSNIKLEELTQILRGKSKHIKH